MPKKKFARTPREPKPAEEKFAVQVTVDDSKLGLVLRCIANIKGAEINGVLPVTQHDTQRNIPRGEFRRAVIEIISKANGGQVGIGVLKEALKQMGFASRRHSATALAIKQGKLKRHSNNTVSLGSWKEEG